MKLPKLVQGEPARSADAFAGHGMQPSDNSIGHDKNSVRSPDSGAGLEQLGPQTGESDLFRPVYTCGEPVEDEHVAQMSSVSKRSTKTRCRFQRTLGGAVVNDSRAIVSYGGKVCPCLITGTDARSDRMIEELGDEFSSIRVALRRLPGATQHHCKRSLLYGSRSA